MSTKHDADGFLVGQPIGTLTLRGVLADTLGGMPVVRGYAKLSTLAARSVADEGYQRELNSEHISAIQVFYDRREYLFFPEVVLALELQADYAKAGKPDADPLQLIRQGLAFKSNVNGVIVKATGTRAAADLTRVNISLPEAAGKALKRIDGNHRISAFEAMDDVGILDSKPVSFCIVLLPQGKARQFEKALFYNINSKALPLTSEEVYKGIVEDEAGFADDVLKQDFGAEFVLCRHIRKLLNFAYLPNLQRVFGQNAGQADRRCSVLIEALRDLQNERQHLHCDSPLPSADVLLQKIQRLNETYADERMQRANALGLFSAFMFFAIQNDSRYRQFETWVLNNHQYELQTINASDLIRIFEKIAESRHRQIFVSMQFKIQDAKGQLIDNPNWEAIKAAVAELNTEHQFDLKLKPIRIDEFDKGYSYPISGEIFQLIEDSGYLIADLTAGNKNVYHEVGLLMGLNQARQKGHDNFLLLHNSSVGDVSKDFGFNIADFKQLRLSDTHSIGRQVKTQVAIYYGLAGRG